MRYDYDLRRYDFKLLLLMLVLNTLGILIIRSATGAESFKDPQVVRQIMGSLAGSALAIGLSLINYQYFVKHAQFVYLACIGILLTVKLYGTASNHAAVRWIELPVIGQIQPAEFVKLGLILFFAWFLSKMKERINRPAILLLGFAYLAVPIALVLLQPNMSTAIIMTVIIIAMFFASSLSYKWMLGAVLLVLPFILLAVYLFHSGLYDKIPFLQGYQAQRILTFLNPSENMQTYYQQANSIMAIGSGQLAGKGLNNHSIFSVKNGNFLVEEDNDFIFAVIGEELGFRYSVIIIVLFLLIVLECLLIGMQIKSMSGRLVCVGMAAWLGFQTFTNIAVATGIFPNTGITLPFFSRGSSSLISIYMGMGLILNIALQRKSK